MVRKIYIFKYIFLFIFLCNNIYAETIIGKAKVIDGDTLKIGKYTIRLFGIDAPEAKQTCKIKDIYWNCGEESTQALINIINLNPVKCLSTEKDKYNRYIAECYINQKNINRMMVKTGWAIAYRYYSKKFIEEENFASSQKIGIWKGSFIEPYLYRKKNN